MLTLGVSPEIRSLGRKKVSHSILADSATITSCDLNHEILQYNSCFKQKCKSSQNF